MLNFNPIKDVQNTMDDSLRQSQNVKDRLHLVFNIVDRKVLSLGVDDYKHGLGGEKEIH